ncbi:NAD(P)/FAD-dependent oxidoreductase [Roseateles saccharophilus]|nr:FAD-dependent oxidoreductase [Roseateles saccharophilus]MDG0832890.1 FAD-dependent oxidoreductase [Roseateles saccharophilus]
MPSTVFERLAPAPHLIDAALAGSVQRTYWLDELPGRRAFPALEGSAPAGLAIVGGGYLGLWTAILAKERHPELDVVLLEADRIGGAASGRNGGFCEASITHGEENALQRWPEEVDQLRALGEQNLDEFEATLRRYQIDCDFERTGVLTVAVEPHQAEQLRAHDDGHLSQDDVRAEVNSPTYLAGLWEREGCALVHPGKLAVGLTQVASELGVRLFEQSPVKGMASKGAKMRLATPTGTVLADRVVLATNAFPSLLKRFRFHTVPVYDYVLMTEQLSAAQLEAVGWRHRQGIADMGNQFHYYRLTRDNRILFGGFDAIYHFGGKVRPEHEARPESFRRLASHFLTTFPQLQGIRFTHRWAGAIDTSSRFCAFFVQSHGGRVAQATGFTGLGVGATRFAANVLLDRLFRLDTERTRLRMVREVPMPFPPEPIAFAVISAVRRALNKADHNHGKRGPLLRVLDALGLGFDS